MSNINLELCSLDQNELLTIEGGDRITEAFSYFVGKIQGYIYLGYVNSDPASTAAYWH